MKSIVSEKGQVTIPKEIRDMLGLKTGTELEFRIKGSDLIAQKKIQKDAIQSVVGILKARYPRSSPADLVDEIRGPSPFKDKK